MYKKYMLSVILAGLLAISFVSTALAGDAPQAIFCGALSQDDCQLMNNAQDAMRTITSGTGRSAFEFEISGIPDAPISELAFGLYQDAIFSYDAGLMEQLAQLQADPLTLMSDPVALSEQILAALSGINSQTDYTLVLSEELAQLISAESDFPVPAKLSVTLSMVDGHLYIRLDELAEVIPELGGFAGWVGVNLVEFLDVALTDALAQAGPLPDVDALAAAAQSGELEGAEMFLAGAMVGSNPEFMAEHMDVVRLEDATVGDNAVAVFNTSVDFTSLMQSEPMQQMMVMAIKQNAADEGNTISDEEAEEMLQMVNFLLPSLTQGLSLDIEQLIGLDDHYIYGALTAFGWDLSSIAMMAQASGDDTLDPDNAPFLSIGMAQEYDDFNVGLEIRAPEGAMLVPTAMLLEGLESMQ